MPTNVAPHDTDAERAVLGGMLVSANAVSLMTDMLRREDFYSENHRIIFDAMVRLHSRGEPIDQITLPDELGDEAERSGGKAYVFKMVESFPTAANIEAYAEIIREKAARRRLTDAGARVQMLAIDPGERELDQVIDEAEQIVYKVSDVDAGHNTGLLHPKEGAWAVLERIDAAQKREDTLTGVPSGFYDLDAMTLGYDPGDLVVLAARPAMGKTAIALNKLWHISHVIQKPTAIFSLEMSKEQLYDRLVAAEAGVSLKAMQGGTLRQDEFPSTVRAANALGNCPLYVDDSGHTTVASIRARIRRLNSRLRASGQELGMVAIDYLGLMNGTKDFDNPVWKVSEITRELKLLAKDLQIPVLLLSQLNRGLEQREDKRPKLSDLRDSGSIEQDADIVEFLYRDEVYYEDSPDRGTAELIVAKQRNGPTGTVRLVFKAQSVKFDNFARGISNLHYS